MTISGLYLRELRQEDEEEFIRVMRKSHDFHHPFITAPETKEAFNEYLIKSQHSSQKSYLLLTSANQLAGVFNISGIVHGLFQSAYLGYYASVDYAGKGLMSLGLKLVLQKVFTELKLHRIEANIQPTNTVSIHLATNNGFIKEGFSPRYLKINGIWSDHFRFALTYEDWISSSSELI